MDRVPAFWNFVWIIFVMASAAVAQNATPPPPPPPASVQAAPLAPANDSASTPVRQDSDYIVLKTGKQLNNIYIIRVTPLTVEIGYTPEKVDLKIPRKQIQEIHQAGKLRQAGSTENNPAQNSSNALPAAELDAAFHQKLTTPLPETPLTYENQDIIKILSELAIKADIRLDITEAVNQLPSSKRQVSVTINRGSTLAEFLQNELGTVCPDLQAKFEFDHVVISLQSK